MAKQNLNLYRGIAYNMTYTHVEAMTGGTVYFTIKLAKHDNDADDSDSTIKKTVTVFVPGIVHGDVTPTADAKAEWLLDDADMYVAPGNYFYDLIYEDSDGLSYPPIFEGKVKILEHPSNRNVGNE